MKIYFFDPETGRYQGEDFADNLPMCQGAKLFRLMVPASHRPLSHRVKCRLQGR